MHKEPPKIWKIWISLYNLFDASSKTMNTVLHTHAQMHLKGKMANLVLSLLGTAPPARIGRGGSIYSSTHTLHFFLKQAIPNFPPLPGHQSKLFLISFFLDLYKRSRHPSSKSPTSGYLISTTAPKPFSKLSIAFHNLFYEYLPDFKIRNCKLIKK